MEARLRLVALPCCYVAIVEVRIFVCTPIVEHTNAHLHAQVLQWLIAHRGLQAVAGQRVSLREVSLVLVVAEEAQSVEVESQLTARGRVDEWLFSNSSESICALPCALALAAVSSKSAAVRSVGKRFIIFFLLLSKFLV